MGRASGRKRYPGELSPVEELQLLKTIVDLVDKQGFAEWAAPEVTEQADFVVCVRVVDQQQHVASAIQARCSQCQSLIWFDAKRSPKRPKKLCSVCWLARLEREAAP